MRQAKSNLTYYSEPALAAGVARMGETSEVLTGSIMAIGLVLKKEELSDIQAYRDTMQASHEMNGRFKEELGSSIHDTSLTGSG